MASAVKRTFAPGQVVNTFLCPLCRKPRIVMMDRKGYPFIPCQRCGMIMFIKGGPGQDKLNTLIKRKHVEATHV